MEGFELRETLTGILTEMRDVAVDLVPRILTGVAVLLVGMIVAKIIERVLRGTLSRVHFDTLMDRVGLASVFTRIGIRDPASRALSRLVYYLLLILFVQGAASAVGLAVVTEAIAAFFAFLPHVIAAVLLLLLGNVVGQFAQRAVEESGRESGIDYAPAMGKAVSAGIMFLVAIMAISQLGIDTDMIRTVVVVSMSGVALALALSFGLGAREATRNIVAGFYLRRILRVGESLEAGDQRGIVTAITPTKTLLDLDGHTVSISNHRLLDESVRQ